jgi:predicted P-loop ATPase
MMHLDAALSYAAAGWRVLPLHTVTEGICSCGHSLAGDACQCGHFVREGVCSCGYTLKDGKCKHKDCHSPGKHPRTRHGVADATTDEPTVRAWWEEAPDASIGLATGVAFVVLDIDPRNGGDRTLAVLEHVHGALPPTLECATGGGGRHLFFSVTEATKSKKLGDGLDFQGVGKYVVAAPSIHASGRAYAWANDLPMAPLPEWIREISAVKPILQEAPTSGLSVSDSDRHRRAAAYLRTMDPAISGSGGHSALFRAAVALVRGFDIQPQEALSMLATDYNPRCQPPWSKREIEHKVSQAFTSSTLPIGYLLTASPPRSGGTPTGLPAEQRDDVALAAPKMLPPEVAHVCAEVSASPLVDRYVALERGARALSPTVASGALLLPAAVEALMAASGLVGTASEANARKAAARILERATRRAAAPSAPSGDGWQSGLLRKPGKTELVPSAANAISILTHHEDWAGVLAYDEHKGVITTLQEPPWHADDKPSAPWEEGSEWSDADDTRVQTWLQRSVWGLSIGRDTICTAVEVVARRNTIHPVRDWLRGLRWDGEQRLDTWGVRYLGCEDSAHVRRVCRWWLMSAVARAIEPGCQVDYTLVLEGDQGEGKTAALRVLGGKWFTELDGDLQGKDPIDRIHGVWIAELSELSAMNRTEEAALKGFLTRRNDRVRLAYARRAVTLARGCVFAATVNPDGGGYLKDPTGNRRYWPVTVGVVDVAALAADRDQLLAEALHEVDEGRPWWPDRTYRDELREVVAERETVDPWQPIVEKWLRGRSGMRLDPTDLLTDALGLQKGLLRQVEKSRVINCAKRAGWVYRRLRDEAGDRHYVLIENPDTYRGRDG